MQRRKARSIQKIAVAVVSILLVTTGAYGDKIFDKICETVKNNIEGTELSKIESVHKKRFIKGEGYVKEVIERWGDVILIVVTDKDYLSLEEPPVIVKLYLRKKFVSTVLSYEEGKRIFFFGTFRNISKNALIIRNVSIAE